MFGFLGSHVKCDAGVFLFTGSLVTILLVLAIVGMLSYFR